MGGLVAIYILYNIHHPEEVAQRYPGVIRQILTHHSYITCFLGGAPKAATAMSSTINDGTVEKENLAMAILELENGALAHFQASFAADDHAADNWTFTIKLIGTKGSTRFSHADWVQNQKAVVHSHTYSAYHYSIRNTVRFFIEECIGNGKEPLSNLDDAIKKFAIANGVDTQGLLKDQEQIQQEQQQQQQQQFAQKALADPRVAIEAGQHIEASGKEISLDNEGQIGVANKEQ